jgi:hypothetical protein
VLVHKLPSDNFKRKHEKIGISRSFKMFRKSFNNENLLVIFKMLQSQANFCIAYLI